MAGLPVVKAFPRVVIANRIDFGVAVTRYLRIQNL